ncbi:MAG: hypothetical protein J6S67_20005 [Methanobrevibacter sp.]|nr:hypothetical protein [Methanobrevibacter sp.]
MKRFLILSIMFTILVMLPKLYINADGGQYQGPDGNIYEYCFTTTNASGFINQELKIYSHYPFAFVRQDNNGTRLHLVTLVEVDNQYYTGLGLCNLTCERNTYNGTCSVVYNSDGSTNYIEHTPITAANGSNPSYQWSIMLDPTPYTNVTIYDTYALAYEDLSYVEPTYYYDATLSTPDMNVVIIELPTFVGMPDDEYNFFSVGFNGDSNLNLEVYYKTYCPDFVQIGLNNGNVTYKPITYEESQWLPAYHGPFSSTISDSNIIWIKPVMFADSDYFSSSVPAWQNNFNNSAFQNHMNDWINKYSYCMPLYGNKIELAARYYYDSGTDRYVGPWVQWINTYPSEYNTQVPSNYVAGDYVPGLQNQNNNIEISDQPIITGETTGSESPLQVTINQSVPNYPDYPTAVSYNHDVSLLKWITTANQLPSLMGQFGNFLSSAFTFIDPSIWAIIGFGFLCCIGIMIVKIL